MAQLDRIEAKLAFLGEWQAQAAPAVHRLIADQAYRDDRILRRTRAWKVWSIRLAVIVAALTIAGAIGRDVQTGLRLLGLP
jgi:hypothetical protein